MGLDDEWFSNLFYREYTGDRLGSYYPAPLEKVIDALEEYFSSDEYNTHRVHWGIRRVFKETFDW